MRKKSGATGSCFGSQTMSSRRWKADKGTRCRWNVAALRNALPGLQLELKEVSDALHELERGWSDPEPNTRDDSFQKLLLAYHLERAKRCLAITLEGTGLIKAYDQLQADWKKLDLEDLDYHSEIDVLTNPGAEYLRDIVDG